MALKAAAKKATAKKTLTAKKASQKKAARAKVASSQEATPAEKAAQKASLQETVSEAADVAAGFTFDASIPVAPHVILTTHNRVAKWSDTGSATLRAKQPLTAERNRWRVRVKRTCGWVSIGVVPAMPPSPVELSDYGRGLLISHLGGWMIHAYADSYGTYVAKAGAYAPSLSSEVPRVKAWHLLDGETVPRDWFCEGRIVECMLDFATKTLEMTCACDSRKLRGTLNGWTDAPLYPAVWAYYGGTELELLL
jgi:hypothetical protein